MSRMPMSERRLDAMPDTLDFRDRMFIPTLVQVPPLSDLASYRALDVPVLDQGREGACTGFALATVANYLLRRLSTRAELEAVSARMFYTMAKRYDEWPGERYEGSSARGAMKGWHKHGVCADALWKAADRNDAFDRKRALDALQRPLGAYFRVNHKDLIAMHAAITEVGVLYATSAVHTGWDRVGIDGAIRLEDQITGGHAFAIVGYDRTGFWIQNSWGEDWGRNGLAHLAYGDWLKNGDDVWVARLGAPVELGNANASAEARSGAPMSLASQITAELRQHIITLENDGRLRAKGTFGLTDQELEAMMREEIPARLAETGCRRLVLHAHGGLVSEDSAIQYVANHRQAALAAGVFPVSIIWRSDAVTTLTNILQDVFGRRRASGVIEDVKDFMLDRVDDTLEPVARLLGGKALWDEMKENATLASTSKDGGARKLARHIKWLVTNGHLDEVHLTAHSAGAVLHAPLIGLLTASNDLGPPQILESVSLWAPACTIELFEKAYLPKIEARQIEAFDLYTLDDDTERDDNCAHIYNKSLLYLVSNAFEKEPRIPLIRDGVPLLGLEKCVRKTAWAKPLFSAKSPHAWHVAPATPHSGARKHGDFDNDTKTLASTLARITGKTTRKQLGKPLQPRSVRRARITRALAAASRP